MEEGSSIAEVSLYQNGVLLETPLYVQNENVPVNTISTALFLGKGLNSSPGQGFIGALDDVGVWSRALTNEEVLVLFDAQSLPNGCVDEEACNYDSAAVIDDGTCHYNCLFCLDGTVWSDQLGGCVVVNPSDTDFDGCVGMTDLLDLLSVFGTCNDIPWSCGDPLEYQGYDYETVQIGEQCWFAENLRSENYRNGNVILSNLNDNDWMVNTQGATTIYENDFSKLALFGRLYNSYAVEDERGLCPGGWSVPSDEDWVTLEIELGMSEKDAWSSSSRGTDQGFQLKFESGWEANGNGSNSSGFSALPGGTRDDDGSFSLAGQVGFWWTSTPVATSAWYRRLDSNSDGVFRNYVVQQPDAFSIRCIQDSE